MLNKRTFLLLTLAPLNHKMDNNLTSIREETLKDLSGLGRAPKVQIWNGRNQMKLSGKRTLFSTELWKIRLCSSPICLADDAGKRYRRCKFC